MAWNRTLLTIAVLAALLVRGVVVSGVPIVVGVSVVAVGLLMIGLGLARLRQLAKHGQVAGGRPPRRTIVWEFVGLLTLACLGVIFAVI